MDNNRFLMLQSTHKMLCEAASLPEVVRPIDVRNRLNKIEELLIKEITKVKASTKTNSNDDIHF